MNIKNSAWQTGKWPRVGMGEKRVDCQSTWNGLWLILIKDKHPSNSTTLSLRPTRGNNASPSLSHFPSHCPSSSRHILFRACPISHDVSLFLFPFFPPHLLHSQKNLEHVIAILWKRTKGGGKFLARQFSPIKCSSRWRDNFRDVTRPSSLLLGIPLWTCGWASIPLNGAPLGIIFDNLVKTGLARGESFTVEGRGRDYENIMPRLRGGLKEFRDIRPARRRILSALCRSALPIRFPETSLRGWRFSLDSWLTLLEIHGNSSPPGLWLFASY